MCAVVKGSVRDVGECRSKRSVDINPLTICSTILMMVYDSEKNEAMLNSRPGPETKAEYGVINGVENAGGFIDESALRHLTKQ